MRADAEQRVTEQAGERDGGGEAQRDPDQDDAEAAGDDAAEDVAVRAPSATRMPISRVRCVTRYIATP